MGSGGAGMQVGGGGVGKVGCFPLTSYMCCELALICDDARYFPMMSVNNKMCWVDFIKISLFVFPWILVFPMKSVDLHGHSCC